METIARPYARAAFYFAEETGMVDSWLGFLMPLAACLGDEKLAGHLMNPTISRDEKISLLLGLFDKQVEISQQNFVRLLLLNNRISLLPAIARFFEEMKLNQANQTVAQVYTAFPLEEMQKQSIIADLSRSSGKKILLNLVESPHLKGGMIIELDGKTMDYSIKGRIEKLQRIF